MDEQKAWLGRGWAFPVRIEPSTGGIAVSEYENDIRESIQIILRTSRGERVMRPDFGCGIHDLVFATPTATTLGRVAHDVRLALVRWEPRVEVLAVDAAPDPARPSYLLVRVDYRVRTTNNQFNLVYPFYLERGGA